MLRGQLLSSNITLNTSCKLLRLLICYLWPPLTFSTSADHQNSVLRNPRTSIHKGKAHKLKPMSSNPLPSCLVPRLAYTLPLSCTFVGVRQRNHFWQWWLASPWFMVVKVVTVWWLASPQFVMVVVGVVKVVVIVIAFFVAVIAVICGCSNGHCGVSCIASVCHGGLCCSLEVIAILGSVVSPSPSPVIAVMQWPWWSSFLLML